MTQIPCLHRRSTSRQFHFRRAVPLGLRPLLGRAELTGSLGTDSTRTARIRCQRLLLATDTLFRRLEETDGRMTASEALNAFARVRTAVARGDDDLELPSLRLQPASTADARPVAAAAADNAIRTLLRPTHFPLFLARYRAAHLAGDDVLRVGYERAELPALRATLTAYEQSLRDAIALDDPAEVEEAARAQLEAEHIDLDATPPALIRQYCLALLPVELDVVCEQLARLNGTRVETPAFPADPVTWQACFDKWVSVRLPKERSKCDTQDGLHRFRAYVHDKAPADVTEADAKAYRQHLLNTVSRHRAKTVLSYLRPVFEVSIAEELLPGPLNPFANVHVTVTRKSIKSYHPFSLAQLNNLFRSPVYTVGERPGKGGGEAAYWLPLLGLFSGKRLNSLGTLRVSNFFMRSGRYWFGSKDKTEDGERAVPMHRMLETLGLPAYIEQRRREDGNDAALFPELKASKRDGSMTRMFSTWVNAYIDKHVVDDRKITFHSLRNNFEDELTEASVSEEQRRALQGHTQRGMTERYGRKDKNSGRRVLPDRVLIEGIDKLRFDGLDLKHLLPR